jgi:uncharacterized membrane protein YtjA (UPF0391 family)
LTLAARPPHAEPLGYAPLSDRPHATPILLTRLLTTNLDEHGGAGIAFLAAWAAKATLWPFEIFLALFVVALIAGWVITRERGDGRDDSLDSPHGWLTSRQ